MREEYGSWLTASGYQDNTRATQLYRVGKVEQYYGSLDEIVANGGYEALIAELTYSTADERLGKPNPSRIIFDGNIRSNLQSYKNAAALYHSFLGSEIAMEMSISHSQTGSNVISSVDGETQEKQRLSLERDMQIALRNNINLLEDGLSIIDDGIERTVLSGRIDILCRDRNNQLVVVELKAGKTDAKVIGQTLGYMGDLMVEDGDENVRGIIVAHEFDQRTRSAAKAVQALSLFKYAISFRFEREE